MKKTILILIGIITFSCSSDDDEGCKCEGKFTRANNSGTYFYVNGVDCDTGQPALDQQNSGEIGQTNPAFYVGCND